MNEVNGLIRQALAQSPYGLAASGDTAVTANPLRMFRGEPATIADLLDGWAIERPYLQGNTKCTPDELANELVSAGAGDVWVLRAEAGEGKTTALRQLALALTKRALVLNWRKLQSHEPALVQDAVQLGDEKGLRTVVFGELDPALSSSAIGQIAQRLKADPLPCPLLIAAAPAEAGALSIPGARVLSFARTDDAMASAITTRLVRLFEVTTPDVALDELLPNLRSFAARPDPSVLKERALLVGLLRATYGQEYRARLVHECVKLEEKDALAGRLYRLLCSTHAVGIELPIDLAAEILKDDRTLQVASQYAEGAPWVLNEDGDRVSSRHQIIARTLMSEAGLLRGPHILALFHSICSVADTDDIRTNELVRGLVAGYADWHSVADERAASERKQCRAHIRDALMQQAQWLAGARATTNRRGHWGTAAAWSSAMYHLLPDPLTDSPRTQFLLDQDEAWLQVVQEHIPPGEDAWLKYLEGKAKLLRAQVAGRLELISPLVLADWEMLINRPELGVDFYVDCLYCARAAALSASTNSQAVRWAKLASRANSSIGHLSPKGSTKSTSTAMSMMLNELYVRLARGEFESVLRVSWEASLGLGEIDAKCGTWLAELLIADDELGSGDSTEPARGLLRKIIANMFWGEALVHLAEVAARAKDDPDRALVLKEVRDAEQWFGERAPLDCALASYAASIVLTAKQEKEERQSWLLKACHWFSVAAETQLKLMWQRHGTRYWRDAISELTKGNASEGAGALKVWQRAERAMAK